MKAFKKSFMKDIIDKVKKEVGVLDIDMESLYLIDYAERHVYRQNGIAYNSEIKEYFNRLRMCVQHSIDTKQSQSLVIIPDTDTVVGGYSVPSLFAMSCEDTDETLDVGYYTLDEHMHITFKIESTPKPRIIFRKIIAPFEEYEYIPNPVNGVVTDFFREITSPIIGAITNFNSKSGIVSIHYIGTMNRESIIIEAMKNADRAVALNEVSIIRCKDCGEAFTISKGEINYYKTKGLNVPKRCKSCRAKRKNANR